MFSRIINYFLPTEFQNSNPKDLDAAESLRKFKLNIIFCLTIGTFVSIIFVTRLMLEANTPRSTWLNLVIIFMLYIMPFCIKFFSLKKSVFYVGITICTSIVFIRALDTGGIISPIVNWLTIFPLIGLLIVGKRVATVTLLIVSSVFFIIATPETFNLTVLNLAQNQYIEPIVLTFVTLVVFMLAYLYEAQRKINEGLILNIEKELSASKKLASLGGLSGGLAHEINNPLTILSGRLASVNKMLRADEIDTEKMLHACASAKKSVDRIDSIVNALRTFSRKEYVEDLKDVSISHVISESLEVIKNPDLIDVQLSPEIEGLVVKGNSVLLQRVFTNLLNNSIQAIREQSRPWLKVEVISVNPVTLSFQDSGTGITDEIAERIMEPFFTTKGVGLGSGLGLSLSQNIMNLHGGSLTQNQHSKNTVFIVTFSC